MQKHNKILGATALVAAAAVAGMMWGTQARADDAAVNVRHAVMTGTPGDGTVTVQPVQWGWQRGYYRPYGYYGGYYRPYRSGWYGGYSTYRVAPYGYGYSYPAYNYYYSYPAYGGYYPGYYGGIGVQAGPVGVGVW